MEIKSKEQLIADIKVLQKASSVLPLPREMWLINDSPGGKVLTQMRLLKKQLYRQFGYRFPGDTYDYPDLPDDPIETRLPENVPKKKSGATEGVLGGKS